MRMLDVWPEGKDKARALHELKQRGYINFLRREIKSLNAEIQRIERKVEWSEVFPQAYYFGDGDFIASEPTDSHYITLCDLIAERNSRERELAAAMG